MESMLHGSIGKRDWINIEAIKEEIETTFETELVGQSLFIFLMKKDEAASAEIDQIKRSFDGKLGECPKGEKYDPAVLDWAAKCKKNQEERDLSLREHAIKWFRAKKK